MARKRLRQIRIGEKKKDRAKRAPRKRDAASTAPAPTLTEPVIHTKEDIASKLIPLSVLSAREAQKNAEKTIDNVLIAITHVLSEGDLTISDFGDLKASKSTKTGQIQILFTPHERLKRAVEARLNMPPVR